MLQQLTVLERRRPLCEQAVFFWNSGRLVYLCGSFAKLHMHPL